MAGSETPKAEPSPVKERTKSAAVSEAPAGGGQGPVARKAAGSPDPPKVAPSGDPPGPAAGQDSNSLAWMAAQATMAVKAVKARQAEKAAAEQKARGANAGEEDDGYDLTDIDALVEDFERAEAVAAAGEAPPVKKGTPRKKGPTKKTVTRKKATKGGGGSKTAAGRRTRGRSKVRPAADDAARRPGMAAESPLVVRAGAETSAPAPQAGPAAGTAEEPAGVTGSPQTGAIPAVASATVQYEAGSEPPQSDAAATFPAPTRTRKAAPAEEMVAAAHAARRRPFPYRTLGGFALLLIVVLVVARHWAAGPGDEVPVKAVNESGVAPVSPGDETRESHVAESDADNAPQTPEMREIAPEPTPSRTSAVGGSEESMSGEATPHVQAPQEVMPASVEAPDTMDSASGDEPTAGSGARPQESRPEAVRGQPVQPVTGSGETGLAEAPTPAADAAPVPAAPASPELPPAQPAPGRGYYPPGYYQPQRRWSPYETQRYAPYAR
jgi:hypothetical protein